MPVGAVTDDGDASRRTHRPRSSAVSVAASVPGLIAMVAMGSGERTRQDHGVPSHWGVKPERACDPRARGAGPNPIGRAFHPTREHEAGARTVPAARAPSYFLISNYRGTA